jgi:release factor glutamine methyltransferase
MQRSLPDQRTVADLLARAQFRLSGGAHPERAREDAECLLLHILQQHDPERNKAWLMANRASVLIPRTEGRFDAAIERRAIGEPIQYITAETEFYGLPFSVMRDVLIPRPETEHLVERVLALASQKIGAASSTCTLGQGRESSIQKAAPAMCDLRILDIGTGSGAIAVALAHKLPEARITATDLSAAALTVARENAACNHVGAQIRFMQGDLLVPVAGETFDIVVSNPPYVPIADRASLAVEVRDHEPALALFAGDDGLDIYRRLIPAAFTALVPGGFIALEFGYGQTSAIESLLTAAGFQRVAFTPDLQGILRVATAQRP